MAESFIEEFYYHAYTVSQLRQIVDWIKAENRGCAVALYQAIVPRLERLIADCCEDEGYEALRDGLFRIRDTGDLIYVGYLIQKYVIPLAEEWMQTWVSISEQVDQRYAVESTSSGFLTIKDIAAGKYLHSNNDPMDEARRFVNSHYDYRKQRYLVWGCGLGYHVYQLYCHTEGSIPIILYETNPQMLQYAMRYGVLSWIPREVLQIVPLCDADQFMKEKRETDGLLLLLPYVDCMRGESGKHSLLDHYVKQRDMQGVQADLYKSVGQYCGKKLIASRLRYLIEEIRCDGQNILNEWKSCVHILQELIAENEKDGARDIFALRQSVQEAVDCIDDNELQDAILFGDILENAVLPALEAVLNDKNENVEIERGIYEIEYTNSGLYTMRNKKVGMYYHSKTDPMDEARKQIRIRYVQNKKRYLVWGCGLGYHIYQLYLLSNGMIPICVYDHDAEIIKYARQYGALSWIPEGVVEFIHVETVDRFLGDITAQDGVLLLYPYISTVTDSAQRWKLGDRYIQWNFQYTNKHMVDLNFCRNLELSLPDISELDISKVKKDVVIIAGGPSVDDYIDELRRWQGQKTFVAVGTIWKHLLQEGIKPDFAVIFDPGEGVYRQVEGVEDTGTILLLAMQSYWKIARHYTGKIYTICHQWPKIEEYAEAHGLEVWFAGGSVTVLAVEFAVRCFVDRIYLLGADFAYPDSVSHALGTAARKHIGTDGMIPVRSVKGETVYTDVLLDSYRKAIELVASETEGIEYINMSTGGASIAGTVWYEDIKN